MAASHSHLHMSSRRPCRWTCGLLVATACGFTISPGGENSVLASSPHARSSAAEALALPAGGPTGLQSLPRKFSNAVPLAAENKTLAGPSDQKALALPAGGPTGLQSLPRRFSNAVPLAAENKTLAGPSDQKVASMHTPLVHVEEFFPLFVESGIELPLLDSLPLRIGDIYGEKICAGNSSFVSCDEAVPHGFCIRTNNQTHFTIGEAARSLPFDEFALERIMLGRWLNSSRCELSLEECRAAADIIVVPSFLFHFLQAHKYSWHWVEVAAQAKAHSKYWAMLRALVERPERTRSPAVVIHHAFPVSSAHGHFDAMLQHISQLPPKVKGSLVVGCLESNLRHGGSGLFQPPWSAGAHLQLRRMLRRSTQSGPGDVTSFVNTGPLLVSLPYPTSILKRVPFAPLASRRQIAVLFIGSAKRGSTGDGGNWIRQLVLSHLANQTSIHDYAIGEHGMSFARVCVRQDVRHQLCSFNGTDASLDMGVNRSSGITDNGVLPLPKQELYPTMWELTAASVFCIEPAGDTLTRGHFYVAVMMGCIPVLLEGGHTAYPNSTTWWAWRRGAEDEHGFVQEDAMDSEPFVDFNEFAVVLDAGAISASGANVVTLLSRMLKEEPGVVRKKQEALDKVAHLMHYADPRECESSSGSCKDAFAAFRKVVAQHYDQLRHSAADY